MAVKHHHPAEELELAVSELSRLVISEGMKGVLVATVTQVNFLCDGGQVVVIVDFKSGAEVELLVEGQDGPLVAWGSLPHFYEALQGFDVYAAHDK